MRPDTEVNREYISDMEKEAARLHHRVSALETALAIAQEDTARIDILAAHRFAMQVMTQEGLVDRVFRDQVFQDAAAELRAVLDKLRADVLRQGRPI